MVSNKMLLNIHKRLREIFECIEANLFVGKTVYFKRSFATAANKITTGSCTIRFFIWESV